MTSTVERESPSNTSETSRRLHVIVNPMSGNGRTRRAWPVIDRRLRRLGYDVDFRMTEGVGDGIRLGRDAIESGVAEVAVVGGDGTVNEVVNGLFTGTHGEPPGCILSVLPAGTGRDFSRSIGIRSFEHALETIGSGEVKGLDVGRIDYPGPDGMLSRYFVNAGDVGIGAETAALLNRSSKVLGGKVSYLLGAARTIFSFTGRPARITVDGQVVHDGPLAMICLANGRFHAGGMRMAPDASMNDGMFDVLILKDTPKYILLGSVLPRVYFGRHIYHPSVSHRLGKVVRIESDQQLLFEVEGEQPGTTDLTAEILPGALRVRVPIDRSKITSR
jgi:diacylglycerol kinase (ATP)